MGVQNIDKAISKINSDPKTANIQIEDEDTRRVFYAFLWFPSSVDLTRLRRNMIRDPANSKLSDEQIEKSVKLLEDKGYIKPEDNGYKYKLNFPDVFDYNEIMRVMYELRQNDFDQDETDSVFRDAFRNL